MGGLSKYWDGYDNQPICLVDDPVSLSVYRTRDEEPIQRLKTIISTGKVLVEVKHGSMVLDSSLIISVALIWDFSRYSDNRYK